MRSTANPFDPIAPTRDAMILEFNEHVEDMDPLLAMQHAIATVIEQHPMEFPDYDAVTIAYNLYKGYSIRMAGVGETPFAETLAEAVALALFPKG